MPYSQVQSSLPPQFMDYPQQYFPQQTYQQQQLQAQAQHQQQILLIMQQQQQQQQPSQQQQVPTVQTPQQYSQPSSQNENYYFQASRGYAYSQGIASSNSTTNLQQYPMNEPRQSGASVVPSSATPTDKSSTSVTVTTPHFSSDQYNYLVPSLPPLNQIGATPPNSQQQQQQQQHTYDVSHWLPIMFQIILILLLHYWIQVDKQPPVFHHHHRHLLYYQKEDAKEDTQLQFMI